MPPVVAEETAVAEAAREGLRRTPKSLPPWLFYDERGSKLFEQITRLPEYYLTRTERGILARHADEIVTGVGSPVTVVELGAGTGSKTGLILAAAARFQREVVYQPIDVSGSALDEAREHLERTIPGVSVRPQICNYITAPLRVERLAGTKILALYIGSSIGNFTQPEAKAILAKLRAQLQSGDALLLGTDLAPGQHKSVTTLRAAYDDAQGVTAAFNRNILTRLNRELGTNFKPSCFVHRARWNSIESRIEMHLQSLTAQSVVLPLGSSPTSISFDAGETIHTENSYKFTAESIEALLEHAGFRPLETFHDPDHLFAVTLAAAI